MKQNAWKEELIHLVTDMLDVMEIQTDRFTPIGLLMDIRDDLETLPPSEALLSLIVSRILDVIDMGDLHHTDREYYIRKLATIVF